CFFFQAEDGIRDRNVTGVQTCALPISGPIFANIVLADEVNRATPKTQSALLEGMQEHTVSVGDRTRPLPDPFFVLATQNPLEMEIGRASCRERVEISDVVV